jgi:hypothetical protein
VRSLCSIAGSVTEITSVLPSSGSVGAGVAGSVDGAETAGAARISLEAGSAGDAVTGGAPDGGAGGSWATRTPVGRIRNELGA